MYINYTRDYKFKIIQVQNPIYILIFDFKLQTGGKNIKKI